MFDTRRVPLLFVLPAAAAVIAGCGGSAGQTGAQGGATPAGAATSAGAMSSAGVVSASGPGAFTASRLRGALLTRINGAPAAVPVESGSYSALPEVAATKESMHGVKVDPAKCAQAAIGGFNSASFAGSPAAVVTFRVGHNGVSEVIVAPSGPALASALGTEVPAGCSHYQARVDGKVFSYTVRQSWLRGIGEQARVLNVKAAGYSAIDVWSVVYRGAGFVGAVTVVGPDASESAVRQLGFQAYAYATRSLS
jgi:hypothetical protein